MSFQCGCMFYVIYAPLWYSVVDTHHRRHADLHRLSSNVCNGREHVASSLGFAERWVKQIKHLSVVMMDVLRSPGLTNQSQTPVEGLNIRVKLDLSDVLLCMLGNSG